jgi:hypothetical protein
MSKFSILKVSNFILAAIRSYSSAINPPPNLAVSQRFKKPVYTKASTTPLLVRPYQSHSVKTINQPTREKIKEINESPELQELQEDWRKFKAANSIKYNTFTPTKAGLDPISPTRTPAQTKYAEFLHDTHTRH